MTFRPCIRPGAPVLRRDARHLQIGTSPGIVVDDRPGLLALLRLLDGVRDVERLRQLARAEVPELDADVADVLRPLLASGAVIEAGPRPRPPRLRVALHAGPHCRSLETPVAQALTELGLPTVEAPEPDLLIVLSCGEPARAVFDQAHRHGITHLPVVLDEERVRIGPTVVPGHTPCLGCLDLHRTAWDHAWPALLPQLGRMPWSAAPPVVLAPLAHAVAADVAAEVLAIDAGTRPRTAGQVLAVGPAHDARDTWPVAFHHGCSCALLPAA